MTYKGIENKQARVAIKNIMQKHTLHIFSCVLLCFLMISTTFVNVFDFGLASSIKRITSKWTPKQEDFGKIKFVNYNFQSPNQETSVFIVKSPFKNYYANNITSTQLEVFGLGDPIVLSSIDGSIKKISKDNMKYNLVIENNKVNVEIKNLDYVCVTEGDVVSVGTKIAISNDSKIVFRLKFDGEYVDLPASRANTTFFE